MCGEKSSPFLLRWRWIGSPPRVRGKELVKTVCNIWDRITPACAGKSPHAHPQITQNKDHPRVCGEKIFSRLLVSIFKGSPPRVRGKAASMLRFLEMYRITPACAGKSCFTFAVLVPQWDHPRVCGEKPHLVNRSQYRQGSPPRVRGKG